MSGERFESLVRAHQTTLYRAAYRLTGNHEDAQDLLQEALIEAFAAFGRFRMGTHFHRWVMRIMTRTFIDRTRRRPPFSLRSLDEPRSLAAGETAATDVADRGLGPEEVLLAKGFEQPLQAALVALPAEFRLAIVLCDVEGLTYEEAAEAAGCPVGTIRSRLHRGREMMRRTLGPSLRAIYQEGT